MNYFRSINADIFQYCEPVVKTVTLKYKKRHHIMMTTRNMYKKEQLIVLEDDFLNDAERFKGYNEFRIFFISVEQ